MSGLSADVFHWLAVPDKSTFYADQEGELTAIQRMALYLEQHSETIEDDMWVVVSSWALTCYFALVF